MRLNPDGRLATIYNTVLGHSKTIVGCIPIWHVRKQRRVVQAMHV